MLDTIRRIAELQPKYVSENTPEMQERGALIRRALPDALSAYLNEFKQALGLFANDIGIEGSDGIGRKTPAPWVRIFSRGLSPSATTGWYVVIHFATSGEKCFVTLGCGATKWDSTKGDLVKYSDEELARRLTWASNVLAAANADTSYFNDSISIGSSLALPRSFEKATLLCKTHSIATLNEDALIGSICAALRHLAILYKDYSAGGGIATSELATIDVESAVNPGRTVPGARQGYGLNAKEKKAVEIQAMKVTIDYLQSQGFAVTDTSAKHAYDLLASKQGAVVKVEVKGTTSKLVDSILMTANEVALHQEEAGSTALAIVSGIELLERGQNPRCAGGDLNYMYPWDIEAWTLTPTVFMVAKASAS